MYLLDMCNESIYLKPLLIITTVIKIALILIPILLILIIFKDIFAYIINNQSENIISKVIKRVIAVLCIFYIPTIVEFSMSLVSDDITLKTCFMNANKNYIETLENLEEEERAAKRLEDIQINKEAIKEQVEKEKEEKENLEENEHLREEQKEQQNQQEQQSITNNNPRTAQEFLNTLNNISKKVEEDYKNGNAWYYNWNSGKGKYQATFDVARNTNKQATCVCVASWGLIEMGILEPGDVLHKKNAGQESKFSFFNQFRTSSPSDVMNRFENAVNIIDPHGETASSLIKKGELLPGDIVFWDSYHVSVYAGDGTWYDAGRGNPKNIKQYTFTTFGPVKMGGSGKVWRIGRIK